MSQQPMKLDSRISASDVDALQDALIERLNSGCPVQLDASDVDLIDTPPIQVLLGLKCQADKSMQSLDILNPSPAFRDALALLGFEADLTSTREQTDG